MMNQKLVFTIKVIKIAFTIKIIFIVKVTFIVNVIFIFFIIKKHPLPYPLSIQAVHALFTAFCLKKEAYNLYAPFQFGVAFVEFLPILLGIGGATQHFQNIIYDKIPSTLMPQTAYWLVLKKNDLIIFHSELYLLSASYEVNVSYLL